MTASNALQIAPCDLLGAERALLAGFARGPNTVALELLVEQRRAGTA